MTHSDDVAHLEAIVVVDEAFEALGQAAVLTDVMLQSFDAVVADDEPQLERTEATAQRNSPVLNKIKLTLVMFECSCS